MGRLSHTIMKLLLLAVSTVTCLFHFCQGSLCLDSGEVAYLCTAGTPVADKVASALASCAPQQETVRARKQKGKGKGKGKNCPSMDKIFEDIENEFGDDACVYTAMGWLDEEGNVNNNTIVMDVMSLPQEVSSMITYDGVSQCTENMITQMAESQKFKRCSKKYSEEELALLSQVGSTIAGFKCFQDSFNQACGNFIRSKMMGAASSLVAQPQPSVRFFPDFLTCLPTCQAANFAPATSCTAGDKTKPCNEWFPFAAIVANNIASG